MDFYKIPAANGHPAQLAGTQDDARRIAKERGLKPSNFSKYEVRTDKAGLMAHLNSMLTFERTCVYDSMPDAVIPPQPDDLPDHKPAFTQEQVDEMFRPKRNDPIDLPRDTVCMAISEMTGTDLGFVALEVAHRFERLAKG